METHGKRRKDSTKAGHRSGGVKCRELQESRAKVTPEVVAKVTRQPRGNNVHHPVVVEGGRRSVSQVEGNASAAAAFLQVKVAAADMPEFMQVHAFRCARCTYDSLEKFSHKYMAYNMKKEFDRVYGRAWHCIVGPSFGSFVTHSTGCFLYFSMEKIFILMFKTKVET